MSLVKKILLFVVVATVTAGVLFVVKSRRDTKALMQEAQALPLLEIKETTTQVIPGA
jgi:hypothetical protein